MVGGGGSLDLEEDYTEVKFVPSDFRVSIRKGFPYKLILNQKKLENRKWAKHCTTKCGKKGNFSLNTGVENRNVPTFPKGGKY